MRVRLFPILRTATFVLGLILALALGTVLFAFPRSRPASTAVFERTTERLERGRYLVEHVANCLDCHSERDWSFYGGPVIPGTEGQGAPLLVLRPSIQSANITPAALANWSDGEIARAITAGIGRDEGALHPFMPYDTYAQLTQEDVAAVVSYLRQMTPIENSPPRPGGWALKLIGRLLPKPYEPPAPVDRSDSVAYGRYLTQIAECSLCHGSDFAGGILFRIPGTDQEWPSANLTPHPSNRTGSWSRDNFISVFKSFAPPEGRQIPGIKVNTVMPWSRFAGMAEEDLGAIYDFLRTVEPVEQEREATK